MSYFSELFRAEQEAKLHNEELYFERHGRSEDWRYRKPLPQVNCPMCGENYLRCRCGGGE